MVAQRLLHFMCRRSKVVLTKSNFAGSLVVTVPRRFGDIQCVCVCVCVSVCLPVQQSYM